MFVFFLWPVNHLVELFNLRSAVQSINRRIAILLSLIVLMYGTVYRIKYFTIIDDSPEFIEVRAMIIIQNHKVLLICIKWLRGLSICIDNRWVSMIRKLNKTFWTRSRIPVSREVDKNISAWSDNFLSLLSFSRYLSKDISFNVVTLILTTCYLSAYIY